MKKKILIAVSLLVIVVAAVFAIQNLLPRTQKGAKEIIVTIMDDTSDNKKILEKTFHTDAETLETFLKEQEELKATLEESAFGAMVMSLMDLDSNQEQTIWWVYESENNETCLLAGMCPSISEVAIKDKDSFVFIRMKFE